MRCVRRTRPSRVTEPGCRDAEHATGRRRQLLASVLVINLQAFSRRTTRSRITRSRRRCTRRPTTRIRRASVTSRMSRSSSATGSTSTAPSIASPRRRRASAANRISSGCWSARPRRSASSHCGRRSPRRNHHECRAARRRLHAARHSRASRANRLATRQPHRAHFPVAPRCTNHDLDVAAEPQQDANETVGWSSAQLAVQQEGNLRTWPRRSDRQPAPGTCRSCPRCSESRRASPPS